MKRKNKATLFIIIVLPFTIILPLLMTVRFPQILFYYKKISLWFVIVSLLMIVMPIGKYRIGGDQAKAKIPILTWIASIVLLFIVANCFALTIAVIGLEKNNLTISTINLPLLIDKSVRQLFIKGSIFPWSMVALTAITLILRSLQHPFSPFAQFSNKINKFPLIHKKFMTKMIDTYIVIGTKIVIITITTAFIVSLYQILQLQAITVMFIMFNFFFLWITMCSKYFNKMDASLDKRPIPVAIKIIIIITLTICVIFVISVGFKILLQHVDPTRKALLETPPTNMIMLHIPWQSLTNTWSWSWWVIATPFIASIISKISYGRTIRTTIALTLVIPCISAVLFYATGSDKLTLIVTHLLLNSHINWLVLTICLLLLLVVLIPKSNHDALWLGFYPIKATKKLRIVKFKQLWLFNMTLVSSILLHGLQGLMILQIILAIPAFLILLLSIVYCKSTIPKVDIDTNLAP